MTFIKETMSENKGFVLLKKTMVMKTQKQEIAKQLKKDDQGESAKKNRTFLVMVRQRGK